MRIADLVYVNSIKLYADGALGSRGICLLSPYSDDSSNFGFIITNVDTLEYYILMNMVGKYVRMLLATLLIVLY